MNANGVLFAWMNNDYGQCGVNPEEKLEIPKPLKVSDNVKIFSCGLSHLMMVKNDDTVWGLGCNDDGNCGFALGKGKSYVPTQSEIDSAMPLGKIKDIKSGGGHNLLLTTDGNVYASGSNAQG